MINLPYAHSPRGRHGKQRHFRNPGVKRVPLPGRHFCIHVPLRQGASRGYLVERMEDMRLIAFPKRTRQKTRANGADARWQVLGETFKATPREQLETHAETSLETRTQPALRLFGHADK
jgi:hypothetical protein